MPRKDSPFGHSVPFRGSVRIPGCSEQREMGHEGRGGGGGQDRGTSSLVKNRTAEGPTRQETSRLSPASPRFPPFHAPARRGKPLTPNKNHGEYGRHQQSPHLPHNQPP